MSNNNIVLLLKASRDGQSDPYVEVLNEVLLKKKSTNKFCDGT